MQIQLARVRMLLRARAHTHTHADLLTCVTHVAVRYALGRVLRGDLHTPMEKRVVGIQRERESRHREKRERTRRTREKKEKKKKRKKKEVRLSLNIYLIIRSGDLEGSPGWQEGARQRMAEREREREREERIEKAA